MNTIPFPKPSAPLLAQCQRCHHQYETLSAAWCDCDRPSRSLLCPSCGHCFCDAPALYRRQFWSSVPATLRQDRRRFESDRSTFPSRVAVRAPSPVAPVVLIVDDEEAIRSLVACYVEGLGYRTIVSDNPVKALELAQVHDIRVIITDALMPRMDGRELCRRLKGTRGGALRKVIVMTSLYTARHFRTEAFREFGVDDYLSKPVDHRALATSLARFAPLPSSGHNSDECSSSGRQPA